MEMIENDTLVIHNIFKSPGHDLSIGMPLKVDPPDFLNNKNVKCYDFKSGKSIVNKQRKKPFFLIKGIESKRKGKRLYFWRLFFTDKTELLIYGYRIHPGKVK